MIERAFVTVVRAAALALACAAAGAAEVNTANQAQLESVRGIGPQLSAALIERRPFADWDDLMKRVPGVGKASAARLSAAGLRVEGRAWKDAPAPAAPRPSAPVRKMDPALR